jgi:hypothetical protein
MPKLASLVGATAVDDSMRSDLRKYARASSTVSNGIFSVPVTYRAPRSGIGRFVAAPQGGAPICFSNGMNSDIRASLAGPLHHDIDIVNCLPSLAVQLFADLSIPCPVLERYINNRDLCLKVGQCLLCMMIGFC